jgi:hypothetical protein
MQTPNPYARILAARKARDAAMLRARELAGRASYGCAQWVSDAVSLARRENRIVVNALRSIK